MSQSWRLQRKAGDLASLVIVKKRKRAPKTSENQNIRQKKCLNKLRRTLLKPSNHVDVVMDDESYFTVDGSNCYGNDSFHSYEGLEAPEEVKYKFVSKFPASHGLDCNQCQRNL